MQYKETEKIVIDKRKLDVLIRIGCPDKQLVQLIKTGKFDKTEDSLIDDTLECLIDFKTFKNWGGNHNPTGKNQHTKRGQLGGQLDQQDGGQVGGQNIGQVVDKDKDKEIDKDKDKDKDKGEDKGKEKDKYAYEGKVIKLTQKDFDEWKRAYPDLNLYGECMIRDKWLATQPLDVQKTWYVSTSKHFLKRNEMAKQLAKEDLWEN